MNAKTWGCVIVGVLAAHLCVIMIVDNMRTSKAPQPKPIEPNFSTSTMTVRAPDGQALKVVHEFTVETQPETSKSIELGSKMTWLPWFCLRHRTPHGTLNVKENHYLMRQDGALRDT